MKTLCTLMLAALALLIGLAAPSFAVVSDWAVVQSNPGTNCTIGRGVANETTGNVGSTVRSKATCSESASDVNLPADRMGVYVQGHNQWDLCASSGGWVNNAQGTAVKSVTATVYCLHDWVSAWAWQSRKVNSTDPWAEEWELTDFAYFI